MAIHCRNCSKQNSRRIFVTQRTPLHWAAVTGKTRCVALLLQLGADKEFEDSHGAVALHYAQQGQHPVCCGLLLKHDPGNPSKTTIPQEKGKKELSAVSTNYYKINANFELNLYHLILVHFYVLEAVMARSFDFKNGYSCVISVDLQVLYPPISVC